MSRNTKLNLNANHKAQSTVCLQNVYVKLNKNEKYYPTTLKKGNGFVPLKGIGNSIRP